MRDVHGRQDLCVAFGDSFLLQRNQFLPMSLLLVFFRPKRVFFRRNRAFFRRNPVFFRRNPVFFRSLGVGFRDSFLSDRLRSFRVYLPHRQGRANDDESQHRCGDFPQQR